MFMCSMGGAIATHATKKLGSAVVGLVVLDVVEGTAMEALPRMTNILNRRPSVFENPEEAVSWRYIGNYCTNSKFKLRYAKE